MKIRSALCLLAILFAGVLPSFAKTHTGKIHVLIVDGFSNHDWHQTTLLLHGMLDEAGGFDVSVNTMPTMGSAAWANWRPDFAAYDVVIQTCNDNGGNGELAGVKKLPEWPEAVKKDFVEYARNGACTSSTRPRMPS
jgi:hypothetical protein